MDNIGSASAVLEAWSLVNYLEEGGFPVLLWETLKDCGYTAVTPGNFQFQDVNRKNN
jgi:2-methylisocitrate lyase-like PEP mutase family enzyme